MRRRYRVILFIFAAILVLIVALHPAWLPAAYTFLDVSQPPRQADIIVVLGGGGTDRPELGAYLYQEGYAPRVLVSGYAGSMEYAVDIVAETGIPDSALLVNDTATSTYDEAQQVLAMLLDLDVSSVMIVTSPSHSRRALATYQHVFAGHNIELTIVSPDDGIDASAWWKSERSRQITEEYIKMVYYFMAYGVWSG